MRVTKAMKLEIVEAIEATAMKSMVRLRGAECLFCALSEKYSLEDESPCLFCEPNITAHLECGFCLEYTPPGMAMSFNKAMFAKSGVRKWVAAMRSHLLKAALKLRKEWGITE